MGQGALASATRSENVVGADSRSGEEQNLGRAPMNAKARATIGLTFYAWLLCPALLDAQTHSPEGPSLTGDSVGELVVAVENGWSDLEHQFLSRPTPGSSGQRDEGIHGDGVAQALGRWPHRTRPSGSGVCTDVSAAAGDHHPAPAGSAQGPPCYARPPAEPRTVGVPVWCSSCGPAPRRRPTPR